MASPLLRKRRAPFWPGDAGRQSGEIMAMSALEIRASNYLTAISGSAQESEDFGYSDEDPREVLSRIYRSFVVWLTACEEQTR